MNRHRMRMTPEEGKAGNQPVDGLGNFTLVGYLFQYAYLGITLQYIFLMRRSLDISGQLIAGMVALHMDAVAPQSAFADIIDLTVVSNVNRISVAAIVLGEFVRSEFFHGLP